VISNIGDRNPRGNQAKAVSKAASSRKSAYILGEDQLRLHVKRGLLIVLLNVIDDSDTGKNAGKRRGRESKRKSRREKPLLEPSARTGGVGFNDFLTLNKVKVEVEPPARNDEATMRGAALPEKHPQKSSSRSLVLERGEGQIPIDKRRRAAGFNRGSKISQDQQSRPAGPLQTSPGLVRQDQLPESEVPEERVVNGSVNKFLTAC
jgi:hypothetical protein